MPSRSTISTVVSSTMSIDFAAQGMTEPSGANLRQAVVDHPQFLELVGVRRRDRVEVLQGEVWPVRT